MNNVHLIRVTARDKNIHTYYFCKIIQQFFAYINEMIFLCFNTTQYGRNTSFEHELIR